MVDESGQREGLASAALSTEDDVKELQDEQIPQLWADTGQILGRYWADTGQILGRYWADTGQILGRFSGHEQI
jgi:hypothetical protein